MAFTLIQAGSSLYAVNSDGVASSALTLPPGVTLAYNLRPRFCKFEMGLQAYAIVVNTPTVPISVDATGITRTIDPPGPLTAPTVASAGAGVLTGGYLYLFTYLVEDTNGNTIAESDYSPNMAAVFNANNNETTVTFTASPTYGVTGRRLYRTVQNGGVYFPLVDIADNTTTTYTDNNTDASLSTIAGPSLGPIPDLTLVCEFAGRLWGVDRRDVDHLRYTEAGTMSGWSLLDTLAIPHIGSDAAGITALIPRRDGLGVTRRDIFVQVTGSDRTNFKPTTVNGGENVGCVSQESVVVFNDVAYFLFRDGVYQWDNTGIKSLTDGKIRTWFTSDIVFNRSMFWQSFAQFDPVNKRYRLFLASTGSAVINRWIEYDLSTGTWWGPHQTTAFQLQSAVTIAGRNQQPYAMIGDSTGYLSKDQSNKNDWGQPINFSVITKSLSSIRVPVLTGYATYNEPDKEKYFGELTMFGTYETDGDGGQGSHQLLITPTSGDANAVPGPSFSYDMSQGRQRLPRLGTGKFLKLEFDHNVVDEDVVLFGFEVNPVNIIGRR